MGEICQFRGTRRHDLLASASAKLDEASRGDPAYLRVLYARAQLDDLTGRAKDAIEKFEAVLKENPPFSDEAEYYLAVAYYHRYNRPSLEEALQRFSAVAGRASDPLLRCRARLGLTQALGMRLVPADPRDPDLEQLRTDSERLQADLDSAQDLVDSLRHADEVALKQLCSVIHNVKALRWMYSTDFLGPREEKLELLAHAVAELEQADQYDPDNWAIQCDLGSAWMRLGHWGQAALSFENARGHLNRVLQSLRPGYGFAFYEIGRTNRLQGRFAQAVEYFDRALAIPYNYRDVSDRRLNLEKERALAQRTEYP